MFPRAWYSRRALFVVRLPTVRGDSNIRDRRRQADLRRASMLLARVELFCAWVGVLRAYISTFLRTLM